MIFSRVVQHMNCGHIYRSEFVVILQNNQIRDVRKFTTNYHWINYHNTIHSIPYMWKILRDIK